MRVGQALCLVSSSDYAVNRGNRSRCFFFFKSWERGFIFFLCFFVFLHRFCAVLVCVTLRVFNVLFCDGFSQQLGWERVMPNRPNGRLLWIARYSCRMKLVKKKNPRLMSHLSALLIISLRLVRLPGRKGDEIPRSSFVLGLVSKMANAVQNHIIRKGETGHCTSAQHPIEDVTKQEICF